MRLLSLRKLDYLPRSLAIAIAVSLGALIGVWLSMFDTGVAVMGYAVLLSLAAWLAIRGKPITVLQREMTEPKIAEPKPGPKPVVFKPATVAFDPVSNPSSIDDLALETIPTGEFIREGTKISVSAFQCMKYPVTRRLYKKIMGKDPAYPEGESDTRPVNQVSWDDAIDFCNRLSKSQGLESVYSRDQRNRCVWNKQADGFRLPTEAEWEYACRASSNDDYCFGNDREILAEYAWFDKNSGDEPHPVSTKKPNNWQLYDMHGNTWEWCWDWYGDYSNEALKDPDGPPFGDRRVLRGGSFSYSAVDLRSAYRFRNRPEDRFDGFRCVRVPLRH